MRWTAFVLSLALLAPRPAAALESDDCLILPGMTVDVGGTIPGQLAEVNVEIGQTVQKGELLASLRTEVQEATLALAEFRAQNEAAVKAAEARLAYERRELDRAQTLQERGVVTEAVADERQTAYEVRLRELEEAQMAFRQAALELERARAELEIRRVRAPIDGIVADRVLDPGEYLRDDGKVVTLVSLDPLLVEAFLPQEHYADVRPGQTAQISPETALGEWTEAVVETRDAVIDAASATFRVRLSLPNPQGAVVSGVRCRLTLG